MRTHHKLSGEGGTTPLMWTPNGKVFYAKGSPITVKGFTAFKAINIFEEFGNVSFFDEFVGYNNPRIFTYTEWGSDSWDFPTKQGTLDFIQWCNSRGLTPSICLLTDGNPSRVGQARDLVNYLKGRLLSVKFEAVNEPGIYNKTDPSELRSVLESCGFPYASGWYSDNKKHYGNHWLDHSPRDEEWFRKGGHNIYEAFMGGGPNSPDEPALRHPGIEDEPIRPDECGYDYLGYYAYAASCVLLGAGATFHCSTAKYCNPLSIDESICKDYFLNGLNVFPPITGYSYRRIDEPGQPSFARTYVNENYSVRIKQNGYNHPEAGWNSLDQYGIAWSR